MTMAAPAAWRRTLLLLLPLLLGSVREASSAVSSQQLAGLKSLQAAIYHHDGHGNQVRGIPHWPDLADAQPDYDVCNLRYIFCNSDPMAEYISTLDLSIGRDVGIDSYDGEGTPRLHNDKPLTGFNDLVYLQLLYIFNNRFTGPLPTLSQLTSLDTFWADGNRFSGPVPSQWGDLINLHTLYLENNIGLCGDPPKFSQTVDTNYKNTGLGIPCASPPPPPTPPPVCNPTLCGPHGRCQLVTGGDGYRCICDHGFYEHKRLNGKRMCKSFCYNPGGQWSGLWKTPVLNNITSVSSIPDADTCCHQCKANLACKYWSYYTGTGRYSKVCKLFGVGQDADKCYGVAQLNDSDYAWEAGKLCK
eukprot:jgi/Chlat1/1589/Chrsp124S01853